jgi:hypothetical protein
MGFGLKTLGGASYGTKSQKFAERLRLGGGVGRVVPNLIGQARSGTIRLFEID